MAAIVHGICGIGRGHAYRQLPLLRALAKRHRVAVLAYGESLRLCRAWMADNPRVRVLEVTVPYLPGRTGGVDWSAAAHGAAGRPDAWATNGRALADAEDFLGRPDLAVSDYEPTAAMLAYAWDAPLVTFDQQSKFLGADGADRELPPDGADDERARLRLFFPKAEMRLACSFFPVPLRADAPKELRILPPVLRPEILGMTRRPARRTDLLVYLSPQQMSGQALSAILPVLGARPDIRFRLVAPPGGALPPLPPNVAALPRRDEDFLAALAKTHGLICTAGHSLLSEASTLGIPALTLPLPLHEQRLNAIMFARAGGGPWRSALDADALDAFIADLPRHAERLAAPDGPLVRGEGPERILALLAPFLER